MLLGFNFDPANYLVVSSSSHAWSSQNSKNLYEVVFLYSYPHFLFEEMYLIQSYIENRNGIRIEFKFKRLLTKMCSLPQDNVLFYATERLQLPTYSCIFDGHFKRNESNNPHYNALSAQLLMSHLILCAISPKLSYHVKIYFLLLQRS